MRQDIFRRYQVKLLFRLGIFLLIFALRLLRPELLDFRRAGVISPTGLLWLCVLASMLAQLSHRSQLTAGCMKQFPNRFDPVPGYDAGALREAVRRQNRGALRVFLVWMAVNLAFGACFHRNLLGIADLAALCALCYLCDLVCVLFFCPFQFFLMGNRCCVNCRIFAWGSWMMAAPLMLVPHVYAQSLFWTGVLVLAVWELRFRRHPERFWSGSNRTLQCSRCRERLCRYKNHIYRIDK